MSYEVRLRPELLGTGDELYVRARIVSSKHKEGVLSPGEMEQAWTQPVVTGVRQGDAQHSIVKAA